MKPLTNQIIELFEEKDRLDAHYIKNTLGLVGKAGQDKLQSSIRQLIKTGRVERLARGIYKQSEIQPEPPEKIRKMWLAMRNTIRFTISDIQRLTGADIAYIRKYCRQLELEGILKRIGKENARTKHYQLIKKQKIAPAYIKDRTVTRKNKALKDIVSRMSCLVSKESPRNYKKIKAEAQKIIDLI
jgi:predicted transcriptional regulator of viral defense system